MKDEILNINNREIKKLVNECSETKERFKLNLKRLIENTEKIDEIIQNCNENKVKSRENNL